MIRNPRADRARGDDHDLVPLVPAATSPQIAPRMISRGLTAFRVDDAVAEFHDEAHGGR